MRTLIRTALLLVTAASPGLTTQAQTPVAVDLELILMADASGSIDEDEFQLQRRGYARALRDPRVLDAIRHGRLGRIAIAYVEWSGDDLQQPIVQWTLVESSADIEAVARTLEETPRQIFFGGTAPGNAILYGVASIQSNAFRGTRRVIDVSGDDSDIDGISASAGRDRAVAAGMTVNGLPILEEWPELGLFFRDNVIGGPGAFYVPARGFADFAVAVRKKLIREIAGGPGGDGNDAPNGSSLARVR